MKEADVLAIVERHKNQQGSVISILEDIQIRYSYLPEEALRLVADRTGRSLVDLYGIATFYKAFSLKPRGKHLCTVCVGTACHVRGAPRVAEAVGLQLGVEAGDTTKDREFTFETVNCLGACALGPVVVVDGRYFPAVSPGKVRSMIDRTLSGLESVDFKSDQRIIPVEVSCPRCNHTLMDETHPIDGVPSIRVTISFERKHGWLRLSSLYGSHHAETEHKIPDDAVVDFFCPNCHSHLTGTSSCPECVSTLVPMFVRGGGLVQICPKKGCKGHMLDLSGVSF